MRKIGLTIFAITLCYSAFSQFAMVESSGLVNVKAFPFVGSNTVFKVNNGDPVYCIKEEDDGWLSVVYGFGKNSKSGFIQRSTVKIIDSLSKVPCSNIIDTAAVWNTDSVRVSIYTMPFDQKSSTLLFNRGTSLSSTKSLTKIDGKEVWGTDGNVPVRQYAQILVEWRKNKILVPFDNLYEPNLKKTHVYFDWATKNIYIAAANSSGAGSYVALWVIANGKFKQRVVTIPYK